MATGMLARKAARSMLASSAAKRKASREQAARKTNAVHTKGARKQAAKETSSSVIAPKVAHTEDESLLSAVSLVISIWVVVMIMVIWLLLPRSGPKGFVNSGVQAAVLIILLSSQAWAAVIKLISHMYNWLLRHSTVEPPHSTHLSHQICHAGVIDLRTLVCYRRLSRSKPPLRQRPVDNCNWVSDNTLLPHCHTSSLPPLTATSPHCTHQFTDRKLAGGAYAAPSRPPIDSACPAGYTSSSSVTAGISTGTYTITAACAGMHPLPCDLACDTLYRWHPLNDLA